MSAPADGQTPGGGETLNGTVKWFNIRRGYGFIQVDGDHDDVHVHFTGIKNPVDGKSKFKTLGEGEAVEFIIQNDDTKTDKYPNGRPTAKNVTGPKGAPVQGARRRRRKNPKKKTEESPVANKKSKDGKKISTWEVVWKGNVRYRKSTKYADKSDKVAKYGSKVTVVKRTKKWVKTDKGLWLPIQDRTRGRNDLLLKKVKGPASKRAKKQKTKKPKKERKPRVPKSSEMTLEQSIKECEKFINGSEVCNTLLKSMTENGNIKEAFDKGGANAVIKKMQGAFKQALAKQQVQVTDEGTEIH